MACHFISDRPDCRTLLGWKLQPRAEPDGRGEGNWKPQPRAKPDGRGEGNKAQAAHQYEYKPAGATSLLPSATRQVYCQRESLPRYRAGHTRPTKFARPKGRSEHKALKAQASQKGVVVAPIAEPVIL